MAFAFNFIHFVNRWLYHPAYVELTATQQGLLLNLLFKIRARGGSIPNDDRLLAKMSGDETAWPKNSKEVLAFLTKTNDGYRSQMLDDLAKQFGSNAARQRRYLKRLKQRVP